MLALQPDPLDHRTRDPGVGEHRSEAGEGADHRDESEVLRHQEPRQHDRDGQPSQLLTDLATERPAHCSQRLRSQRHRAVAHTSSRRARQAVAACAAPVIGCQRIWPCRTLGRFIRPDTLPSMSAAVARKYARHPLRAARALTARARGQHNMNEDDGERFYFDEYMTVLSPILKEVQPGAGRGSSVRSLHHPARRGRPPRGSDRYRREMPRLHPSPGAVCRDAA